MIVTYRQLLVAAPRCRIPLHRLGGGSATQFGQAPPGLAQIHVRGKKTIHAFKLDDDGLIPVESKAPQQDELQGTDAAEDIEVDDSVPKKTRKRRSKTSSLDANEQTNLPQGLIPLEALPFEEKTPSYPTVVLQARNNMRKFENCVLLTRVGGFYELYFEHAEEFAPLLNLKVAQKKPGAKATWEPVSMVNFHFQFYISLT